MATRPHEVLPAVVERSVEIDADLDEVWRVLTQPDQGEGGGWLGSSVELDLRPGGGGRVVDDDGAVREVLMAEVDAPVRLTWHWWHEDGPLSTVEITATPTSTGTIVRVVETLDPTAAWTRAGRVTARAGGKPTAWHDADAVGEAWSSRLGRLSRVASPAGRTLVAVGLG